MRLFVAIELDDVVRRAAEAAENALRGRLAGALDARWTPVENLHLTLRFIGQVEDDRVPRLVDSLCASADVAPFDLELGDCGAFPPSGPPRVIWIGLVAGLPSLAALRHEYDRRLEELGIPAEARPFSAHLTMARVREVRRRMRPAAVRETIHATAVTHARCTVDRVTVFRSHLSPHGSKYEALGHAPLVVR